MKGWVLPIRPSSSPTKKGMNLTHLAIRNHATARLQSLCLFGNAWIQLFKGSFGNCVASLGNKFEVLGLLVWNGRGVAVLISAKWMVAFRVSMASAMGNASLVALSWSMKWRLLCHDGWYCYFLCLQCCLCWRVTMLLSSQNGAPKRKRSYCVYKVLLF